MSAFLLFGLGVQFWPSFISLFDAVPGDFVDARMNNLVLENFYLWISGHIHFQNFLNPPYYYPTEQIIGWTDTLWGTAPAYAFFRVIGFDLVHSFTLWLITLSSLNFLCTHWVLKKHFGLKDLGASVGAFIFAFSCARTAQIGHPQLFPAFGIPFYFGFLYTALKDAPRLNTRALAYAALALVFQIYSGFYLGWFCALITTIGFIPLLISKEARTKVFTLVTRYWKTLGGTGALSGLALIPQMIPFLKAAKLFGSRPYSSVRATYPQISSFFNMGPEHPTEGWLGHLTGADILPLAIEHRIGIGVITTIFLILALRKKSIASRLLLWNLAFTVGIGYASLWGLVYLLFPGGSAIRAVGRIMMVLLFLAAIPLCTWIQSQKKKWQIAIIAVLLIESITIPMHYSKTEMEKRVFDIETQIPNTCPVFFLSARGDSSEMDRLQIDAMWIALTAGVPTVNGYYGHEPEGWKLAPGTPQDLQSWQKRKGFTLRHDCTISL